MAKVKIEDIVDHLDREFRKALEETIDSGILDADYDSHELFRIFKRTVGRKCSTWETVPDRFVEK